MKKELAKNTLILAIGKICTQLISFLLLPLYTSLLSTAEYGIADLVTVLIMLVVPVITLQLEQGIFRELIEVRDDDNKKRVIISSSLFLITIQIIVFSILFFIVSIFIKNDYKYFLLINTIAYIYNVIMLQIARGLGFNGKYSIGSFLCASFTIVFNIIFLVMFRLGAYGILLGNLCGYLISTLYLIFSTNVLKLFNLTSSSKLVIKKMMKYSIPLVPNAICWWVFNASDKMITTMFLGISYVGILSASLKFSNLISSAYSVFHISWVESISLNIRKEDGNKFFNEMINIIFFLFSSISLCVISVMPFIFNLLVNKNYSSGYNLVPITIIGALFNILVSLVTAVYYGYKDSKSIAKTSLLAAILNIIIHLILIKFIGLYAPAVSTMLAYFLVLVLRSKDINKKYFQIKFENSKLIFTVASFALVIFCYYLDNLLFSILGIFVTIFYGLFVNKNSIVLILNFLKTRRDDKNV